MLLGHTFVFGDIGLRRKITKNLKKFKRRFFQPWARPTTVTSSNNKVTRMHKCRYYCNVYFTR